jgi:hypothetical protein
MEFHHLFDGNPRGIHSRRRFISPIGAASPAFPRATAPGERKSPTGAEPFSETHLAPFQ